MKFVFLLSFLIACQLSEARASNKAPVNREVEEGHATLVGSRFLDRLSAVKSWSKACRAWSEKLVTDNKDREYLLILCGKSSCETATGLKACRSEARFLSRQRLRGEVVSNSNSSRRHVHK